MTLPNADVRRYRFADFELDVAGGVLTRGGTVLPLRPMSFRLLQYLVANPGRLVGKEELLAAVWRRRIVTDGAIAKCLADVRAVLDDRGQTIVKTVHGRGYRFELDVEEVPVTADAVAEATRGAIEPAAIDAAIPGGWRPRGYRAATAAIAMVVLAGAVVVPVGLAGRPAQRAAAIPAAGADRVAVSCRSSDAAAVPGCEQVRKARYFFARGEDGDVARAEREFRAALEVNPGLADAWSGLAGVYSVRIGANCGLPSTRPLVELRLAAIRKALAADPDSPEALARYAQHLLVSGRTAQAREALRRALVAGPHNQTALSIAAGYEFRSGRIDEAIELQSRAAASGPIAGLQYGNLASYLIIAGRYDEARAVLNAMSEFGQQRQEVAHDQTRLLVLEHRYEEALPQVEQWPAGNERDALLAIIYAALGRRDDAALAVARLDHGRDPRDAIRLGEVFAQLGDLDRAMHWVDEARRRWASLGRRADHETNDAVSTSPYLAPLRARLLGKGGDQQDG